MTTLPVVVRTGGAGSFVATIEVTVADPARARLLASAIVRAVAPAIPPLGSAPRIVRVRSRAGAASRAETGAFVLVTVSRQNARHLRAIVDLLRAKEVAGVQLVWPVDARTPKIEARVFAVLEHVRAGTPSLPPLVLAGEVALALSLRILAATRAERKAPVRC